MTVSEHIVLLDGSPGTLTRSVDFELPVTMPVEEVEDGDSGSSFVPNFDFVIDEEEESEDQSQDIGGD